MAAMLLLSGCASGEKKNDEKPSESKEEFVPRTVAVIEAEDGQLIGVNKESSDEGYSGTGYVSGFTADGDAAVMKVPVEEDGFYDLKFTCSMQGGYKENYVYVDGESVGTVAGDSPSFCCITIPHVFLAKGDHEVKVEKYWGYINLDKLEVVTGAPFDEDIYKVTESLVDKQASPNARRVYKYLYDNYGKNIISGQYCAGPFGKEMAAIKKETKEGSPDGAGRLPAMVGLDMSGYSTTSMENGIVPNAIDMAEMAWSNNCIITMCWHWTVPSEYLTGTWYSSFYKEHTNINLDRIMNGQDDKGYELLVRDMESVATHLEILSEKDIPVLWRPLHEASGGWFWWGDCSAESYIKLYKLMYEIFTEKHGLHNLIWVWNGQSADWYPGDDVVDIVGTDIYPGQRVYTSQYPKYIENVEIPTERKIVTLSENGCLVDPELAVRDNAMWSYFGTWSGEFVVEDSTLIVYDDTYTDKEMLKKVYNHENVITRDELPVLSEYEMAPERK